MLKYKIDLNAGHASSVVLKVVIASLAHLVASVPSVLDTAEVFITGAEVRVWKSILPAENFVEVGTLNRRIHWSRLVNSFESF